MGLSVCNSIAYHTVPPNTSFSHSRPFIKYWTIKVLENNHTISVWQAVYELLFKYEKCVQYNAKKPNNPAFKAFKCTTRILTYCITCFVVCVFFKFGSLSCLYLYNLIYSSKKKPTFRHTSSPRGVQYGKMSTETWKGKRSEGWD